jgi:hypothetical protein
MPEAPTVGRPKKHAGFDLRLMPWGDGTGVPTSGTALVLVGTDDNNLLHIRIFDHGGNQVTDTDETKLPPAQAQAISTLKQQLMSMPRMQWVPVMPMLIKDSAEQGQALREVLSIISQTKPGQIIMDAQHAWPKGREGKLKTIGLRVSAEYGDWLDRLARHYRTTVAGIIDRAVAEWVHAQGYDEAPPDRMP